MIECRSCKCPIGILQTKEEIVMHTNGTYHIRGTCMMCDSWIRWVPYAESRVVKSLIANEYNRSKK